MKSKLNLKNFSLGLNIFLIVMVIGFIAILVFLRIIPPFSDTEDTISDIPIFEDGDIKVERILEGLEIPWDVEFLEDDIILVTERTGQVRIAEGGELLDEPALDLTDQVAPVGEAGLMGMAKSPTFDQDSLVYLYHTYRNNSEIILKVVSYEFSQNKLSNEKIILDDIPSGNVHSGGQIEFGPDDKLYITTGDIAVADLAQELDSLAGKTLRINSDGSIPIDNPFIPNDIENPSFDSTEFDNSWLVYSYGHRNAQGIDWHPLTQQMYQSEHGPSGFDGGTGMDEINLVLRGANMGWPVIRGEETRVSMDSPILLYTPAIAPASAKFYDGDIFPEFQNRLLVGALRGTNILVVNVDEAVEEFRLLEEDYGRVRYVTVGPDGAIYFTTSNTDGRGNPADFDDGVYRVYRVYR